jgi:hypothetical protein
MTALERARYQAFRWSSEALHFGRRYGTPFATGDTVSPDSSAKASVSWELAEIYYKVPNAEYYLKTMV